MNKIERNLSFTQIPVELTYLQLTFLDLAANRLSCLPVELRFMVTLVELYLEENPLTCPPANLCGRGRVHIFKYLEIQVGSLFFLDGPKRVESKDITISEPFIK